MAANTSMHQTMNTSMTSLSTPPPTAMRVPHTRVRPGRSKNVIYSTYQHVVELYGPQMPVLVAESLHYVPSAKTTASVNLNPECAWAWYVCGRKLLVWHIPSYKDSGLTVIAKEMLLPSSDLAHHAGLVCVFTDNSQVAPSCVAVSPEGVIRYWELIGHHSTWIDVNANLGGEEVCGVHYIPPVGCLAVTTSGTMVIITPTVVRGTATVVTQNVSQAPGWLGNIGRRVSSIIFGGSSQPHGMEARMVKVLTSTRVEGYWNILLLTGLTLQSWAIQIQGSVCSQIYQTNLEPLLRRAFPQQIAKDPDCEVLIIDIRASEEGGIIALVVSSQPHCYMIVELNGNDMDEPDTATRMCILSRNNVSVLEGSEGKIALLQFLLLPTSALVFNNFIIFAVPLSGGEESDGEPLDLPGGVILGGLMHRTTPIFFSATYGFVSITPVDTACIDVLNTSVAESRATPQSIVAREPIASTTVDYVTHLKVAFTHYIRKNMNQCEQVLRREFPLEESGSVVDSVFATTLIKVSLDIVNDLSPKDHRWGDVHDGPKLAGTMSLHLDTQLAEKRQAHDIFLQFAKDLSSTISLGKVTRKGRSVRTIHILYEHNEKIIACTLMKKLQKKYPMTIGHGVSVAANEMNFVSSPGLSSNDFFFRYVSIVDEGVKAIITKCVKNSLHNLGSIKFTKLLVVTNDIMIEILTSILKIRTKKGYFIDPSYVPWLSAPEPTGIFDHLSALANITHEALSRFGKQTRKFKKLITQFFKMCNILLLLRLNHCDITEFNAMSSSFIQFFLDLKMYSQGLQLAYKYKNFEYLVKLSYMTQQEAQIQNFIQAFGEEDFCFYLFKWLYVEGRFSELLNLSLPEKYTAQLERFLGEIPSLDWLYKLKQRDYQKANKILLDLASDENTCLKEQEVIYSLAKLTGVTGACSDLSRINSHMEMINAQKDIPSEVLARRGYDPTSLKLLPPAELIELYTGDDNFEENEVHFVRALELLKFITDENEYEALRKKIWLRAIERNEWENSKLDFTPEIVDDFLFFRLMKLVKSQGEELESLIPQAEELLEEQELFAQNSLGSYLLQYGYEQVMTPGELDDLDLLSA